MRHVPVSPFFLNHLITLFSAPSDVYAIPTSPPPCLTNCRPARQPVCFLVTPLIIAVTAAWISSLVASLFLAMWSLTKLVFLFPQIFLCLPCSSLHRLRMTTRSTYLPRSPCHPCTLGCVGLLGRAGSRDRPQPPLRLLLRRLGRRPLRRPSRATPRRTTRRPPWAARPPPRPSIRRPTSPRPQAMPGLTRPMAPLLLNRARL